MTDHKPVLSLFDENRSVPALASSRIQRWALTLAAYQYTIKYRPGKDSFCADALSRLPMEATDNDQMEEEKILAIDYLTTTLVTAKDIRLKTRRDPWMSRVLRCTLEGWLRAVDNELLPYWRRREELSVREGYVLWGDQGDRPFMGRMFLVIVDAFSKWLDVYATQSATTEVMLEKLKTSFAIHGIPKRLVLDNGTFFMSSEFRTFCKSQGIIHTKSAPYHPSSTGLDEWAVQILKDGLRKLETESLNESCKKFC